MVVYDCIRLIFTAMAIFDQKHTLPPVSGDSLLDLILNNVD